MAAIWRIELLGGLRLLRESEVVDRFRTQKTAALLAFLAYHQRRAYTRDELIELLWPEDEIATGRHKLSVALSSLRGQLEPPGIADGALLVTDRLSIRLDPTAIATDAAEFEAALRSAASASVPERAALLEQAVALYRGELLAGLYESWILPEQQRLATAFEGAVRGLIALREAAGEPESALDIALRASSADRYGEEIHAEVIRLYLAAGQPAAALRRYRQLEQRLREELDAAPSLSTLQLARQAEALTAAAASEGEMLPTAVAARPAPRRRPTPEPAAAPALTPPPTDPSDPTDRSDAPEPTAAAARLALEPPGGAVPLGSPFYVERRTDSELHRAIGRGDSIVLLKGPRQVGKTSLLARGLQQARQAGKRVVLTDFQSLNAAHLESAETVLLALAGMLAEKLDLDALPEGTWDSRRGANPNFRRYFLRAVLGDDERPLVWGMDEVDRLFSYPFASEIFGLFRSWHNERALDPDVRWGRLTMAIAYATEAHLFITDVNQSPFNVGTRLALEDFTTAQVSDLNQRYGRPLRSTAEVERFHRLLGGHPFLSRCGLDTLVRDALGLDRLEEEASNEEGPFGEHLRRILVLVSRDVALLEALREVLRGRPCPTVEAFYRLRSAGVLVGVSAEDAALRCPLYAAFLERHLL